MGGSVGLKGTDGEEILRKAIELGAKPVSPARTIRFLKALKKLGMDDISVTTAARPMGEEECFSCGIEAQIIGEPKEKTTAEDTKEAARAMKEKVDLIVFAGGDGTARDILDAVGEDVPVLGIPTGVKMHSSVFAESPEAAATIVRRFFDGELSVEYAEVMDVDEEAFREGRLSAKLYGYVKTPYEPQLIQGTKMASPFTPDEREAKRGIAKEVVERMEKDVLYIIGPGTTTKAIADALNQPKTLLGVDVYLNGKLVARDVNEKQILSLLRKHSKARIIVTPIGRQGFIFGRGNQQISAEVLKQVGIENVTVVATPYKIANTPFLRVDTGDPDLDAQFPKYMRVISGYKEEIVVPIRRLES